MKLLRCSLFVRSESVSTLAQKRRHVECPRCNGTMSDVVSIDPLYEQPGLIAYECNDCHYVTSEIVPAENGRGPRSFLDDAHHAERRAARQGACRGPENPPRQAAQRHNAVRAACGCGFFLARCGGWDLENFNNSDPLRPSWNFKAPLRRGAFHYDGRVLAGVNRAGHDFTGSAPHALCNRLWVSPTS